MTVIIKPGSLFENLSKKDATILTDNEAVQRSIRELHIGIVNMMPDAAIRDTEVQFTLPLHYASSGLHIVPHFVAVDGVERGAKAQEYIDKNYETVDQVKEHGLDGLIITGANISDPDLRKAKFYEPLADLIGWAESDSGPTSTLYSCLASHAYMLIQHNEERSPLKEKRWGVFQHKVTDETHPLLHGMDTVFDIPHSRWNEIREEQFQRHHMNVLVVSEEAGVHMATSPDGLRAVLWQGHPEYNTKTLLGEFQRDLSISAERRASAEQVPIAPLPENYFQGKGFSLAQEFQTQVAQGHYYDSEHKGRMSSDMYREVLDHTPNRWSSSKRALLGNWIAAILDKTNEDVNKPFMDGVNEDDVFDLKDLASLDSLSNN